MVMPRSRSMSMESSTCSFPAISRSVRPPVIWIRRSASVDLPWSIWATMEKLRMLGMGTVVIGAGYHSRPRAATILLYFQGLCSRQADFNRAENALRKRPMSSTSLPTAGARTKTRVSYNRFRAWLVASAIRPSARPWLVIQLAILHAVLWTLILLHLKAAQDAHMDVAEASGGGH